MGATVVERNYYNSADYGLYINIYKNGGDTAPASASAYKRSNSSSVTVSSPIPSTAPTWAGHRFLGYAVGSASAAVTMQPGNMLSYTFNRVTTTYTTNTHTEDGITYEDTTWNCRSQGHDYDLYAKWEATTSTVSTTNGTLGSAQTITITRNNSSYTHTLRYSFAGHTETIATGVATSYSWTPAVTLAAYVTNAGSAICTIYCDTYNGGTLLGTTQTTCTLSIPATVKCTIASVALAETVAGINSKFGGFVQNKSQISVAGTFNSGSGSPAYGATVAAVSITINGQTLTSNGATTNILNTSGTNSYTFTITDTRGRTDSYTGTFNVIAYTAPAVVETAERNSADNTQIDLSYTWTISACSNLNDKAISISYWPIGSTPTTVSVTPGSYTGSGTYTISSTDPNDSYIVTVTVTDYFSSTNASSAIASTGNRAARVSYADKKINLYYDTEFYKTVDVIQRRCSATLSSAGWYRVFLYSSTNDDDLAGGKSANIRITITREGIAGNSFRNEVHFIDFSLAYGSYIFSNETSVTQSFAIDKIRYGYDLTNHFGFIDIHCKRNDSNPITVSFNVATDLETQGKMASVEPYSVADAHSGETILAEYDFVADTQGYKRIDLPSTIAAQTIVTLASIPVPKGRKAIEACIRLRSANSTGKMLIGLGATVCTVQDGDYQAVTLISPITTETTVYATCYVYNSSSITMQGSDNCILYRFI